MWSVLDPLVKNTIYLPDEFVINEDAETIYKPELETCKCKNGIVWIGNVTLSYNINLRIELILFIYRYHA